MTKANTVYHNTYEKKNQTPALLCVPKPNQTKKKDKVASDKRSVSFSPLHLHITTAPTILRPLLAHVLEQEAPLKVLVGVHNGLELRRGHDALVLGLLELVSVDMFEYAAD